MQQSPFKQVRSARLSDVIVEQLERMILEGSLAPGQRLPAERELAAQFSVSRPSLREAIQKLEVKGLLDRRQGGGTYVCEQSWQSLGEPLFDLLIQHPESQFDLLEFRHALEGICAYYSALRGTAADHAVLQQALNQVAQAADAKTQAQAVMAFHLAMAEASHNAVVLQVMHCLKPLLQQNISDNMQTLSHQPDLLLQLQSHRQALLRAICQQEPELARTASQQHLAFIEDALLKASKEKSRVARSLRRLNRQEAQMPPDAISNETSQPE